MISDLSNVYKHLWSSDNEVVIDTYLYLLFK